MLDICIVN